MCSRCDAHRELMKPEISRNSLQTETHFRSHSNTNTCATESADEHLNCAQTRFLKHFSAFFGCFEAVVATLRHLECRSAKAVHVTGHNQGMKAIQTRVKHLALLTGLPGCWPL